MRAKQILPVLVLVAATASTALAHDMFLKLQRYFLAADAAVTVPLLNGTFTTSENAIARRRIADISVQGPEGRVAFDTAVVTRRNDSTFLALKTGAPGTYVIGVSTRPNVIAMTGEQFHEYLAEEGLGHVAAARRRAGTDADSVTEQYAKHVKAVVQVGDRRTATFDAALGYPAELVPLDNPYAWRRGGRLRFRALARGAPIPGLIVISGGQAASGSGWPRRELRTDAAGIVTLRPDGPGIWYVTFIDMRTVSAPDHNYESEWATLTFQLR